MNNNLPDLLSSAVIKLVNNNVIEKLAENTLTIIEESTHTGNSQVKIQKLKKYCYAFKLDYKPHKVYLLKEETKVNDELLIWFNNDKITVFLIELKSGNMGNAYKQIKYGKQYADFLLGILETELNRHFEKEYRGYIFKTKVPSRKRPIRREEKIKCYKKEDDIYFMEFSADEIHDFRYLSLPITT